MILRKNSPHMTGPWKSQKQKILDFIDNEKCIKYNSRKLANH